MTKRQAHVDYTEDDENCPYPRVEGCCRRYSHNRDAYYLVSKDTNKFLKWLSSPSPKAELKPSQKKEELATAQQLHELEEKIDLILSNQTEILNYLKPYNYKDDLV